MRVELVHDHRAVHRVDLTALIPGHHPRRHASGTHHDHEGIGVVFAEAAPGLQQELIHGILGVKQRWLEGVDERLFAEIAQHSIDKPRIVLRRATQTLCQLAGGGVVLRWQGQLRLPAPGGQLQFKWGGRPAAHLVLHLLLDFDRGVQAEVGGTQNATLFRLCIAQAVQPVLLRGQHEHTIGQRVALTGHRGLTQFAGRQLVVPQAAPGTLVEDTEYQAPPVQSGSGWNIALELYPERHLTRLAEGGNIAGFHEVADAGFRRVTLHWHRPQRPDARKQKEQHKHQWKRLRQHQGRQTHAAQTEAIFPRPVQGHQPRGHKYQREQGVQDQQQVLTEQKADDTNEVPQKQQHIGVLGFHQFEQFEGKCNEQQRNRWLQTQQVAVTQVDSHKPGNRQQRPQCPPGE